MNIQWNDNHTLTITPPKRPKKITGTRFAAIMGLNRWTTPFNAWCAITRTYEKPFEDTIYTVAGKTIEPKQAEFMKNSYFMPNLVTPTQMYGENYYQKTYGDFFRDTPIFGGMWDYLLLDDEGKVDAVLEMKTTKRSEDWNNDIPEYYAMQAALYAYLLHTDRVIMVCSFLEENDYADPDKFVPNVHNTMVREFSLSQRYPNMQNLIDSALGWWNTHVVGGVSPEYDEKADEEILKILRNLSVEPTDDYAALLAEAEQLKEQLDANKAAIAPVEARYKVLTDAIKQSIQAEVEQHPGVKSATAVGLRYDFVVSKSSTTKYDAKAMKADGVYEKYASTSDIFKLTVKERKPA